MATKITVNGITYDSLDAMPPEARRLYEQTLANLPELSDHDGNGIPDIVESGGTFLQHKTTVRKRFIVNGTTYDDENSMPPDVRAAYQQAMQAANAGGPSVKKNEIKLSFSITGPGFHFGRVSGTPSPSGMAPIEMLRQAARPRPSSQPGAGAEVPTPIEPEPVGGGLRMALVLVACTAVGLVLWLLLRSH